MTGRRGAVAALLTVLAAGVQPATSGGSATATRLTAQEAPDEDRFRVYLMTMGQGSAIWEHFGHNALVIEDQASGNATAWNWGLFDFRQSDFIPRFLRGEMMYWMDGFEAGALMAAYQRAGRTVWIDELALTQAQARELQRAVTRNALPENRFYRYDYFVDNCSTRVRDALDLVLGGRLREQFGEAPSGFGYRHETERLTQRALLDYLGITLLLGPRGDVERSEWEQMFTPLYLREKLTEAVVPGTAGEPEALISTRRVAVPGGRPPAPSEPPSWIPRFALGGVVAGALVAGLAFLAGQGGWKRVPFALVGTAWSLLAGVGGVILLLVHWTDHVWMYGNENILQLNPLSLILAVAIPVALFRSRPAPRVVRLAAFVAALAVLGFLAQALPGVDQQNGVIIAMTLPTHLGVAWGLRGFDAQRRE